MCRHSRSAYARYARRERFENDAGMRVSRAERERVVDRLRVHAGEERLDVEELEQRIEAAYAAGTRGELAALLADLPEPPPTRRRDGVRRAVALSSAATLVLPLVLAILLFSFAPAGLAWIGWPILGWWLFAGLPAAGFGFAACGYSKRRHRRTAIV